MVAQTSNESLLGLLNEMRPFLIRAGVPSKQIYVRSKKHNIETLARAFDWLHDFRISLEYVELLSVWALLPASTWKNYEMMEIDGLHEQALLKSAKKKVLKKWRHKRPTVFNRPKKKNVKKETNN